MRPRLIAFQALLIIAPLSASAAEPPAPGPAAASAADGVKRDPRGLKGISPFAEAVARGDRAYAARNLDAALTAYREALIQSPESGLGQLRLAAALLAKGTLPEAEQSLLLGLRLEKEPSLRAKLLFALADLQERQKALSEATTRWSEYAKLAAEAREAVTYPETAKERLARLDAWKKLQESSAQVKARIDERLQEANAAARKSAADPKN